MEKNGLKVSSAKIEHLQTTEETDPVGMKSYMGKKWSTCQQSSPSYIYILDQR